MRSDNRQVASNEIGFDYRRRADRDVYEIVPASTEHPLPS